MFGNGPASTWWFAWPPCIRCPAEVLEAAELDNCGWRDKLFHIIIPLLRPTLLNLYILAFIGKMKVFDLVWIMTQGGPLWATETVSTYVYKRAFNWNTFDLGYPSAIATDLVRRRGRRGAAAEPGASATRSMDRLEF